MGIDKDGLAPDKDHPAPLPQPEPATDCVELYDWDGFQNKPLTKECDSMGKLPDNQWAFYGIKFAPSPSKPVIIDGFKYQDCYGTVSVGLQESHESIKDERRRDIGLGSFAYVKLPRSGCIDFYLKTCNGGLPAYTICNNINDTTQMNFSNHNFIKSLRIDAINVRSVSICPESDFGGWCEEIKTGPIYNLSAEWRLKNMIENGRIRSIRINHWEIPKGTGVVPK